MNNVVCSSPVALSEEVVKKRLQGFNGMLDSLADRGIFLNTWQALELQNHGEGNRGLGKTQLAYVRICESYRDYGFHLSVETDLTQFDPDAMSSLHRKMHFLRGLGEFIAEFYSDIYTIAKTPSTEIHAVPIKSKSRRWWNG